MVAHANRRPLLPICNLHQVTSFERPDLGQATESRSGTTMLGGEELYAGGISHPFDVMLYIGEFVPCDR